MAKSALPLIAAAGAAAFFLTSKKKKPSTKKDNGSSKDPNIVMEGTTGGWGWRVRKHPGEPGFGDMFFGEIKSPKAALTWSPAHDDGRSTPEEAKNLALESIAAGMEAESDKEGSSFNWDPARAQTEKNLRAQFPDVNPALSVIDNGAISMKGNNCQWAIMDVLPPVPTGAYVGMVICPKTGEHATKISNSIEAVKNALEIA